MPKPVLFFATTTGVAAIVAAYLWQQLHTERELSAQLQEQVAQLNVELARQPAERVVIREVEVPARSTGDPVATGKPAAPAAPAAPPPFALNFNSRDLLKDPEYREGMALSIRGSMAQNYPDIARELNLTPEQTEKLFDLLTRQQLDSMASSLPDAGDPAAARETFAARSRQQQAELTDLLGASGYQRYQDYQQTRGVRQQVTQLASALSSSDPLSELQRSQLTSALVSEQKRQIEESRQLMATQANGPPSPRDQLAMMEENLKRTEDRNRKILDAAAAYLNAQQLDALRKMQNQSLSMSRAVMRAQRTQLETGSQ